MSRIDEKQELENYQNEVLNKAFETMSGDDIVYIEEDLRSFCTQEMAVFRAFADIVYQVEDAVVIIDTAPTGHTLLLLDATESYHKEVERTKGQTPFFVQRLLKAQRHRPSMTQYHPTRQTNLRPCLAPTEKNVKDSAFRWKIKDNYK